MEIFAKPTPLLEGASVGGDAIAVLPTLFHLMWLGVLVTDLSTVLSERSVIALARR